MLTRIGSTEISGEKNGESNGLLKINDLSTGKSLFYIYVKGGLILYYLWVRSGGIPLYIPFG